jgi:hypothetical protein
MGFEKNPSSSMIMELFGPTVEFLTSPQEAQNGFCVLLGTIPPGVFVPPHSHADIAGSTYSCRTNQHALHHRSEITPWPSISIKYY